MNKYKFLRSCSTVSEMKIFDIYRVLLILTDRRLFNKYVISTSLSEPAPRRAYTYMY